MIQFDNHAFKGLDTSLKGLFDLLVSMSSATQELIALLPSGLERADAETFAAAKLIDKKINDTEIATDQWVADIINKFTITGEDLRFILAAVKTAAILERAADKIKNCIKRLSKVSHPLDGIVRAELSQAISAVRIMLGGCLPQLVDYQEASVTQILEAGAQVQNGYRAILLRLHASGNGVQGSDASHILLVAKNLEQAADMAVEIIKIGHYVNFGTKYEKRTASQA